MTNYEKIKNMTIDEMAEFLCGGEFGCDNCTKKGCETAKRVYRNWLNKESEE